MDEILVPADGYDEDDCLTVDSNDPAVRAEAAQTMTELEVPKGGANGDVVQVSRAAFRSLVERSIISREECRRAMALACTDSLTKVSSRRALMEALGVKVGELLHWGGDPLSVIFLDVDHFKSVNDEHGHPTGDAVLATLGDILQNSLRIETGDLVARFATKPKLKSKDAEERVGRYGGEEFICIVPHTNGAAALVAERLRVRIRNSYFRSVPNNPLTEEGKKVPITASFGVATFYPPEKHVTDGGELRALIKEVRAGLIGQADQALLKAKAGGRDCVFVLDEQKSPEPFRLTETILTELQARFGGKK